MPLFFILGFVFISFVGAILHFAYDFFNQNKIIAFFVSVNESTWEHLKLALFPTFVWALVGLQFSFNNYAFAVFVAIFIITTLIPIIFYTYFHFTKKSILFVNILSFFVAVASGLFVAFYIMMQNQLSPIFNIIGIVGISLYALCFMLFTFLPPRNFLFLDPITKEYGTKANHGKHHHHHDGYHHKNDGER